MNKTINNIILIQWKIYKNIPGGFSPHDGTIDFYLRIRAYVNKDTNVLDLGAGKGD